MVMAHRMRLLLESNYSHVRSHKLFSLSTRGAKNFSSRRKRSMHKFSGRGNSVSLRKSLP